MVAISASSSFTGMWIAQALRGAGHRVFALCSQASAAAYEGTLRGRRLTRLRASGVELVFGMRAETGALADWIAQANIDYFIHHHHFMTDFRSPHYDLEQARRIGLEPLPDLVQALVTSGAQGVVYSGTYFEPLAQSTSPYGFSKGETWRRMQELCGDARLPLAKVVIANPVGPLENADRLIPSLVRASLHGSAVFKLHAPQAKVYPLPVTVLSDTYVSVLHTLSEGRALIAQPSLGFMSNQSLAENALRELVQLRLKTVPCGLDLNLEGEPRPAIDFVAQNSACDWPRFWDFYAETLRAEFYLEGKWCYENI